MLGWIIPVAQYVLIIATGCLLVAAAFLLLDAATTHQNDKGGE
jgi:hypothetical protein